MMSTIYVVLVDAFDRAVGRMEKLEAHQKGLLHRAVTVYVFNRRHELLLQRRAADKYHCGGLWSNTCCGHPFPQENIQQAAQRRLFEEMGMRLAPTPVFELTYKLPMQNGLIENEYGHVFFAISDAKPVLNPQEADAWRYVTLTDLQHEMAQRPEVFTPWFLYTFPRIPQQLSRFLQPDGAECTQRQLIRCAE